MNDLIINDLYEIRNYLDQVVDYVKKLKTKRALLHHHMLKQENIYMRFIAID